ncbi:MAG TPA: hypothetical protein VK947_05355 [Planococcus sp. (in: firmicutes)]|nr:hypothetical protein [Planococcus sp. (in: firmicutes)]
MARKGWITFMIAGTFLLGGCGASLEERMVNGVENARESFEEEPVAANETVGDRELFVPRNYIVEEPSDAHNIIITRGSDSFVLFLNPNEEPDSTLFYDLQKANDEQQWAVDETFRQNGRFGFATVREIADDRFEIVVSAGGVKMTTISEASDIDSNMDWMMQTVKSVDPDN